MRNVVLVPVVVGQRVVFVVMVAVLLGAARRAEPLRVVVRVAFAAVVGFVSVKLVDGFNKRFRTFVGGLALKRQKAVRTALTVFRAAFLVAVVQLFGVVLVVVAGAGVKENDVPNQIGVTRVAFVVVSWVAILRPLVVVAAVLGNVVERRVVVVAHKLGVAAQRLARVAPDEVVYVVRRQHQQHHRHHQQQQSVPHRKSKVPTPALPKRRTFCGYK